MNELFTDERDTTTDSSTQFNNDVWVPDKGSGGPFSGPGT